jgi:hypothetical protein
LEQDFAATLKRWKFAFLHRSFYSSSRHGPDEKIREDLEPLFARHDLDVAIDAIGPRVVIPIHYYSPRRA